MSNHAEPQRGIVYTAKLPAAKGKVIVTLEETGAGKVLKVFQASKRLGRVPVPASVSAFDLPYWVCSILRTVAPNVESQVLAACEDDVRRNFPSKVDTISICMGPKAEFHHFGLLHIDRKDISIGYHDHKSAVVVTAPVRGLRFIKTPSLVTWTIIFQTRSDRDARRLKDEILESPAGLLSLDGAIAGIVAFNRERWLAAGLTVQEVLQGWPSAASCGGGLL
jgi:hypothetical protein